jgi:hypothetical protein
MTLILGGITRKTALRVAAVPADEFEAAVESDDPATVARSLDG